ncbi:MAG: PfkB family carbohydrate kinase [Candidatus Bathyarchaeia archaeon]
MKDLTVLGHLTIDLLKDRRGYSKLPGGPAYYTSIAGKSMNLTVTAITKVGEDYPCSFLDKLRSHGVEVKLTATQRPTTTFEIEYDGDRKMRLLKKCADYTFEDLNHQFSRGLHLGPVAGEISSKVAYQAIRKAEFTSLDVQGFIRSFDDEGKITLRPSMNNIFTKAGLIKCSLEEAQAITDEMAPEAALRKLSNLGPRIVILTLGPQGAFMAVDEKGYRGPAYPQVKVRDVTGAGDVFVGAFLSGVLKQSDELWSFSLALAAASIAVEKVNSLSINLNRKTVEERAEWIHNRIYRV